MRLPLRRFLASQGFDVLEADSLAATQQLARQQQVDAAIVDFSLPDGDGLEVLAALRAQDPAVCVVILTGHGTIDLAVRAIKEGAEQFLTKPVELKALQIVLVRGLENRRIRRVSQVGKKAQARQRVDPFFGTSPRVAALKTQAERIATSTMPVLIQGETGTGKGVLARWLHDNGPRAEDPFVDLNCAGLARELLESELFGHEKGAFTGAVGAKPGLLEMAHRGTLFLDEIGDVDLHVQAKLLKVVEDLRFRRLGDVRDRTVNVRLIAATHRDLPALVREQKFREDLYYRINALPLVVPPLRERGPDVVALARGLVERIAADVGRAGIRLSQEAEAVLLSSAWPGNVRQLRNVLERAILLTEREVLDAASLGLGLAVVTANPDGATSGPPLTLEEAEKRHIEAVLQVEGSVPRAAEVLGLSRSSLYERIRKHGIAARKN